MNQGFYRGGLLYDPRVVHAGNGLREAV